MVYFYTDLAPFYVYLPSSSYLFSELNTLIQPYKFEPEIEKESNIKKQILNQATHTLDIAPETSSNCTITPISSM